VRAGHDQGFEAGSNNHKPSALGTEVSHVLPSCLNDITTHRVLSPTPHVTLHAEKSVHSVVIHFGFTDVSSSLSVAAESSTSVRGSHRSVVGCVRVPTRFRTMVARGRTG